MAESLLPAVVQDAISGRVLMVGYVNDEALGKTEQTGLVHFWSRSRGRLWQKGETSGHVLKLVDKRLDCDSDTWLIRAIPEGPACHTGSQTCFGTQGSEPAPHELALLYDTIIQRLAGEEQSSYVKSLAADVSGARIADKIAEEAKELGQELIRPRVNAQRVCEEAADLFFHALVGMAHSGVSLEDVQKELHRRQGISGLVEKSRRGQPKK